MFFFKALVLQCKVPRSIQFLVLTPREYFMIWLTVNIWGREKSWTAQFWSFFVSLVFGAISMEEVGMMRTCNLPCYMLTLISWNGSGFISLVRVSPGLLAQGWTENIEWCGRCWILKLLLGKLFHFFSLRRPLPGPTVMDQPGLKNK